MTPLRDLLAEYFSINPRIRSELTRDQYRFAANDFAAFLRREPTDDDLDDATLSKFSIWLSSRGLAPRTTNERVGRLCSLWSWLTKCGRKKRFPLVARVPEPHRIPVAWTESQLKHLIDSLERVRGWVGEIPARDWWRSLHLVAWSTGERISAMIACRWDHLIDDWLTVPAEIRKGQSRDMAYRLSPEAMASLAVIHGQRERIWPWPHNRTYLWTRYKEIRRAAGLPTDRRSSFHRIRKSVATHVAAAGGNPTQALGHTDPRITQAYLDPRILKAPQASDYLFRIG
jgi:integrase